MRVLNYTTSYMAVILLLIIPMWAGLFYYAMLDEIYDSIDDGLDNRKGLIIRKAALDSTILNKTDYNETDYTVKLISESAAKSFHDLYLDTMMYMENEQDYEPVRMLRTVFLHEEKYYELDVATSMVEEDDLLKELLFALIWLYAGLIATILLVNNFVLRRIWKPFYTLIKYLKNFRLETPSIPVHETKIDEFRQLNEAVLKMLKRNIEVYSSQKEFIENASHELQTPLAISINKLESLASSGSLSEEQSALLSSALENLERLTRLNRSLLLLSKIENRQFINTEKININQIIKRNISDFEDQLNYKQQTIRLTEMDTIYMNLNTDLADILITNLIKNAIIHSPNGGDIHVEIAANHLTISNSPMEGSLSEERIFDRFYKDHSSNLSTGLGLAIAHAITDMFGISIKYRFEERHIFTLQFPQK